MASLQVHENVGGIIIINSSRKDVQVFCVALAICNAKNLKVNDLIA